MKFTISLTVELEGTKSNPLTRLSWRRRKEQVKKRDRAICQYCGAPAPDGHADHIVSLSKGGTDNLDNLAWACSDCNSSKGNQTLKEWQADRAAIPEADTQDIGRPQDPLDPKHVALALSDPDLSQRELNRRFSIGFVKAKRVLEFVAKVRETQNQEADHAELPELCTAEPGERGAQAQD